MKMPNNSSRVLGTSLVGGPKTISCIEVLRLIQC